MAKQLSPFTIRDDGRKSWTHQEGDKYLVTGITLDGKRFSMGFSFWYQASMIGLYRGRRWLVRDGKRHMIEQVWN